MLYYCNRCGEFLGRDPKKQKCLTCGYTSEPPVMERLPKTRPLTRQDKLLLGSQPRIALVITSHARLRLKQREIKLKPLIRWLRSQTQIPVYRSGKKCEIVLPSRKRLVGEIDGTTLTINTALHEHHDTRLESKTLTKSLIRLSNYIAVAEMEKEK